MLVPDQPWVTVNVCPPMVSVPVLSAPVVFSETEYATVPFPLPVLPDVMVIHAALLVAVHEQPVGDVMETLPVPALAVKVLLVEDMEKLHEAPLWVTVKVFPATAIVPVRELVLLFCATE